MDTRTGEFQELLDDEVPPNMVGPFERGDAVGMGNIVMTHQFGLTVRIAQVGAVVEHLGQKFRVMKLENGNAVLRSMVGAPGKTHDPAKAAAADDKLTDKVIEDGVEFCSEAEVIIEEDAATADLRRRMEDLERTQEADREKYPEKGLPMATQHEPDELDKQLTADQELSDALCAIEEGLTDWEVTFIESITDALTQGMTLSPAQREKANEILTEKE